MTAGRGGLQLSAEEEAGVLPTQGEVGVGVAPPTTALLNLTVELSGLSPKLAIAKLRCWLCHQSFPSSVMLEIEFKW